MVADDHETVRKGVSAILTSQKAIEICGEAENGKIAVEQVEAMHPDIVILDFQMPVMNGLEAARQISHVAPHTAMVMFTMHPSKELFRAAQAVGVRDVVAKTDQLSGPLLVALKQIPA